VPGAPPEAVRRWLFRAAYCQAISALRRRRLIRWESLDAPGAVQWETLSSLASFEDQVVESAAMQAALADLSTRDVTCLILHVVQGFTAVETAEIMEEVAAYRASDGTLLWHTSQIPGVSSDLPVIAGLEMQGAVYLQGRKGGIYALDTGSGTLLWSDGPGEIGGFASGLLITYTYLSEAPVGSDAIYGLNPSTGAVRWTYTPAQTLARISIP
jgi:outer membrane protein assembly factor BamB